MLKRTIGLVLSALIIFAGIICLTPGAIAVSNQNKGATERTAVFTADKPNYEISIYPRPNSKLERIGYGLPGDEVTIKEQMRTDRGFSWYRVRFDNEFQSEGWVQEKFLTFLNPDRTISDNIPDKNRYLGNRSPQGDSRSNQRQYNNHYQQK